MRDAATTLNNRGVAYDKAGEYDREIDNYDEAIRMNPDYVTAFCNRGKAYIEKGQYDHAIADFDEAIRLNPNFALAFNNRGVVYQAKGKKEKSRAGFMQKTFGTPGQEYFEKAKVDFAKARQLGYKG
jgi:tetratricopeptide (TPR) repeat protein